MRDNLNFVFLWPVLLSFLTGVFVFSGCIMDFDTSTLFTETPDVIYQGNLGFVGIPLPDGSSSKICDAENPRQEYMRICESAMRSSVHVKGEGKPGGFRRHCEDQFERGHVAKPFTKHCDLRLESKRKLSNRIEGKGLQYNFDVWRNVHFLCNGKKPVAEFVTDIERLRKEKCDDCVNVAFTGCEDLAKNWGLIENMEEQYKEKKSLLCAGKLLPKAYKTWFEWGIIDSLDDAGFPSFNKDRDFFFWGDHIPDEIGGMLFEADLGSCD